MNVSISTKIQSDVNAMTIARPELISGLAKVRTYRRTMHPSLWEATERLLIDFLMIHVKLPFPVTTGRPGNIRAAELLKEIEATPAQRQEIAEITLAVWLLNEDRRNGVKSPPRLELRTAIMNWVKRKFGGRAALSGPRVDPAAGRVETAVANIQEVTSDATA